MFKGPGARQSLPHSLVGMRQTHRVESTVKHTSSRLGRLAEGLAGHREEVIFPTESGLALCTRAVSKDRPSVRGLPQLPAPWVTSDGVALTVSGFRHWLVSSATQEVPLTRASRCVQLREATVCHGQRALELLVEFVFPFLQGTWCPPKLAGTGVLESPSSQSRFPVCLRSWWGTPSSLQGAWVRDACTLSEVEFHPY